MIDTIKIIAICVHDQAKALAFYTKKY